MSYSALASKIRNNASNFEQSISKVDGVSFDGVWAGDASTKLNSDLKTVITTLKKQKNYSNILADALDSLQKYKNNKEKIEGYQSDLNRLDNTEENASKRSYYREKINTLQSENSTLKSKINNSLNGFVSVSSQLSLVNYQPSNQYTEFVVDLHEMLALFESGKLVQMSDSNSNKDSLYDFYSKEEVDRVLREINTKYSGRNAAVNSALGVMQLAAQVGMKLDYDLLRGSNKLLSTDGIATGSDCVSFASWAISQGSDKVNKTYSTTEFVNLGKKIDYASAKSGDVFALKYSDPGGHVMLIVENHPETNSALVAEAGGKDRGVVLTNIKYSTLKKLNYSARDLTDFYE